MENIYAKDDSACKLFISEQLDNNLDYLLDILLDCPEKDIRSANSKLVTFVINRLFEIEKDYLEESEEVELKMTE